MSKSEQFGQTKNPKESKVSEGSMELREQFGDRTLRAAQDVYADETKDLEQKISHYKSLRNFGFMVALPGSLYLIGKFFEVDIEKMTGLNISESMDATIRLSQAISMLGASGALIVEVHFEEKLKQLKEKFGVLAKPEDKE